MRGRSSAIHGTQSPPKGRSGRINDGKSEAGALIYPFDAPESGGASLGACPNQTSALARRRQVAIPGMAVRTILTACIDS